MGGVGLASTKSYNPKSAKNRLKVRQDEEAAEKQAQESKKRHALSRVNDLRRARGLPEHAPVETAERAGRAPEREERRQTRRGREVETMRQWRDDDEQREPWYLKSAQQRAEEEEVGSAARRMPLPGSRDEDPLAIMMRGKQRQKEHTRKKKQRAERILR